jgi:hypothetical protein
VYTAITKGHPLDDRKFLETKQKAAARKTTKA